MKKIMIVFLTCFFTIFFNVPYALSANLNPNPPSRLTIKVLTGDNINLPPPIQGEKSLLTGMTPSQYNVPTGWSLVTTQDFEGSLKEGQFISGNITTNFPHKGYKSVEGSHTRDDTSVAWGLKSNTLGSFNEIYLSYFEYKDNSGKMNDELFVARFWKNKSDGSLYQEIVIDFFGTFRGTYPGFNVSDGRAVVVPQGSKNDGGTTIAYYGPIMNVGWGKWIQWELWYRKNSPGKADGLIRWYINGVLMFEKLNADFNGSIDMNDMAIQAGGVYTKLTWLKDNGSCGEFLGDGSDNGPRVVNFNEICPCPNQCPPNGYVPIFKRYIDDVILLKR